MACPVRRMSLFPPQYQLAAKAVGVGLVLAAGATAWHWTPLVGPHATIARLRDQITAKDTLLRAASAALTSASAAISQRDAALKDNGSQAAGDANDTAKFWSGQCKAAFNAGYASRSCSAPAVPDGVRGDLRSLWSDGAYQGSAAPTSGAAGVPDQPVR